MSVRFARILYPALLLSIAASLAGATEMRVEIRTAHPGGNAIVVKNTGIEIELAPDLRGGGSWFYWNIEATASQAGRVRFSFDAAGRLSAQGPAVSRDGGKSWSWLGTKTVVYGRAAQGDVPAIRESFEYEFTGPQTVRLAAGIPYLLADLEAFLKRRQDNPNLRREVLTRTVQGTLVPLLQVGEPGSNVEAMILASRNHACESLASYVHEGFVEEAISDSSFGRAFRSRFVLFSVPIVDVDGVQAGDQGKWRAPHDHNRDYGEGNLYPEVKAIQDLATAHNVRYGLDLHCPFIRGDVHEVFYFDGIDVPHVRNNVDELVGWIREERPQTTGAPLNFMKKLPPTAPTRGMPFSFYFAYRPQSKLGVTLEVPYAQPGCNLDADLAREYGRTLLRAWLRCRFIGAGSEPREAADAYVQLTNLRSEFGKLYRGNAAAAEQLIQSCLDRSVAAGTTMSPYRVEAKLLQALLRTHQKRFAEADTLTAEAAADAEASTNQRNIALAYRVRNTCVNPEAKPADVEARIVEFAVLPYPAKERAAEVYGLAREYYERRQNPATALRYAHRQLPLVAPYLHGHTLNQIAALHDQLNQPDQAATARRSAVEFLRPQLDPVPVSVFGAQMAADLFDALAALPDATPEELQAAAEKVFDHQITSEATRARVRAKLAERR